MESETGHIPMTAMFGLPLLYAVVWIALLSRSRRAGLLAGLLMFAVTFAAGDWAIRQSGASTAGIGFLCLPGAAALTGGLALLFGRLSRHPRSEFRATAWVCLLTSASLAGWIGVGGFRQRARNADSDRRQAASLRVIEGNRGVIARILQEHAGSESAALDAEIETHRTGRTFLIPALETSYVSAQTRDRLASDGDLTIVLLTARNPHPPASASAGRDKG